MPGPHTVIIPLGTLSGDSICTDIEDFIVDDAILEWTEDFTVEVVSVSPCGDVGTAPTTVVSITDNDGKVVHNLFCYWLFLQRVMCVIQQS